MLGVLKISSYAHGPHGKIFEVSFPDPPPPFPLSQRTHKHKQNPDVGCCVMGINDRVLVVFGEG